MLWWCRARAGMGTGTGTRTGTERRVMAFGGGGGSSRVYIGSEFWVLDSGCLWLTFACFLFIMVVQVVQIVMGFCFLVQHASFLSYPFHSAASFFLL